MSDPLSASIIPETQEIQPNASFLPTVVRNSAFVMATQVLMKGMAFLFNIFIVRRLGATHFGQYAAVTAFIGIFAIFSDLGMAPLMLREIARDRKNIHWLLPNVIAIRLWLSALVVVVATLTATLLGHDREMILGILIASCGLFLYAFQGPLEATLMAWERVDLSASFNLVNQVVFWALGTLFLLLGWGFLGLIAASLAGVMVMGILAGRIILRNIRFQDLEWAPRRWKELIKAGLPFGISSLSFSLQGRFDTALMSVVLTDAEVGWYNVPLQLIHMLMLLAQAVSTSMFPSLTRAYSENRQSIYGIVHRSLKYLLIFSLPIAVGGTVLADKLIVTLYTDEYLNSVPLMRILVWTLPFLFVAELMGALIMALQKEKEGAKVNLINAVISIVLNLGLVPTVGALGAAWSRVSARGIRVGQYWGLLGSELLVGKRWLELARVALASAVMGAALFLMRELNVFVAIAAGLVLYAVLLLVLRAIDPNELKQLAGLLLKRKAPGPSYRGSGDSNLETK